MATFLAVQLPCLGRVHEVARVVGLLLYGGLFTRTEFFLVGVTELLLALALLRLLLEPGELLFGTTLLIRLLSLEVANPVLHHVLLCVHAVGHCQGLVVELEHAGQFAREPSSDFLQVRADDDGGRRGWHALLNLLTVLVVDLYLLHGRFRILLRTHFTNVVGVLADLRLFVDLV